MTPAPSSPARPATVEERSGNDVAAGSLSRGGVRRTRTERTRVAGKGADGEIYGVTTVTGSGGTHRRSPCPTCPWRLDAEVGRFPAQAYRESASTAYDGALNTFACHESGSKRPAICAGFLLRNSTHNIGVRLALIAGRIHPDGVTDAGVALYENYRAMAEANGVSPNDRVLAPCRSAGDA